MNSATLLRKIMNDIGYFEMTTTTDGSSWLTIDGAMRLSPEETITMRKAISPPGVVYVSVEDAPEPQDPAVGDSWHRGTDWFEFTENGWQPIGPDHIQTNTGAGMTIINNTVEESHD